MKETIKRKDKPPIVSWEGCDDPDIVDEEWEYMADLITEKMKELDLGNHRWGAHVENFGWRKLAGAKHFEAENGKDLLNGVLPQTDCHFFIYDYSFVNETKEEIKGLKINNYHHDSPTGAEWYYVVPLTDEQWDRLERN